MHPQNEYNLKKFLDHEKMRSYEGITFSKNTIRSRKTTVTNLGMFLGDTLFQDVTSDNIQDYVDFKIRSGRWTRGKAHINIALLTLGMFYDWLYDQNLIDHNPARKCKANFKSCPSTSLSKPRVPKKRDTLPAENLFQEIFWSDKLTYLELCIVNLCDQYFRLDELRRIELNEVDLDNGIIYVPEFKNKSREEKWPVLINPYYSLNGNDGTYRIEIIKKYIAEERPKCDSSYLFVSNKHVFESQDGIKPNRKNYSIRGVERIFEKAIEKVFHDDKQTQNLFSSRVMRHHCITMYLSRKYGDGDPWKLIRMVGHTDTSTINNYVDFRIEDLIAGCMNTTIREQKRCKSCNKPLMDDFVCCPYCMEKV